MKKYLPSEYLDKKLEVEGLQACVLEELLDAPLNAKRRTSDIDSDLVGMEAVINTNLNGCSVVAVFNQYSHNHIVQTVDSDDGGYKASGVFLKDTDMDRLVALWIRYKVEILKQR